MCVFNMAAVEAGDGGEVLLSPLTQRCFQFQTEPDPDTARLLRARGSSAAAAHSPHPIMRRSRPRWRLVSLKKGRRGVRRKNKDIPINGLSFPVTWAGRQSRTELAAVNQQRQHFP